MQMSELQAKSNNNLALCPFCGGEASVKALEYDDDCKVWGVFCESDLESEYSHGHFVDNYPTEAEAIAAWNTRTDDYERAAEYWQRMYEQTFAERTCRDTGENEWHFVCSACGYEQNGYECWNYCPSCGCKVIGG